MQKRRQYFIDKSFQARFVVKFCLIQILACIATGALIYFLNMQTKTVAFENMRIVVKSTADFILPITLQILLVVVLCISAATIVVTILTSHKISGPLYRLTLEFEKLKNKDFSVPIRIRTSDQLQKVAANAEELRLNLQNSVKSLKGSWQTLKEALREEEKKKENIKSTIERIDSELKEYRV